MITHGILAYHDSGHFTRLWHNKRCFCGAEEK